MHPFNDGDSWGTYPENQAYSCCPPGKIVKFAVMKYSCRFPVFIASLTVFILLSCSRRDTVPSFQWKSGDMKADSLLSLADYYESPNVENWEALDSTLALIAGLDESAPAASIWAKSRLMQVTADTLACAASLDSMALAAVDSAKSPYLYSRIRLDMTRLLDDPARQAKTYSRLLEYFADVRDSLRVIYTLYEIQNAYTQVWDDSTQIACLREIKRFTPDSLSMMRDIMDFNILSMSRMKSDTPGYRAMLADMQSKRSLMDEIPEIGAMVYTDLYRLEDVGAYMDTAAVYASMVADSEHPVLLIHDLYRLRLFDSRQMTDSARIHAQKLTESIGASGSIFNMEIIRELIRHYGKTGDTVAVGRLWQQLLTDSLVVAAMDRANDMSRLKAARDMEILSQTLHRERDAANTGTRMIFISLIAVAITLSAVGFIVYRRVNRRQKRALEASLHHTSRRLAAACLRTAGDDDREKTGAGMEAFETAFTQVRPGFTEELLRHHPGLTTYELRLCSLLSIGLDTKEIARILSIQPDSVKKSRQRLRAKLAIPSGMTFVEYFTFR